MPLYEYQCLQCGTRTEVLQKFSDPPPSACEKCGAELKRLPSAPSVQFKGAGWYVTDYARKSGGPAQGESKGEGGGASTSSAGAAEAKGGGGADSSSAGTATNASSSGPASGSTAGGSSSPSSSTSGSTSTAGGTSSGKSD